MTQARARRQGDVYLAEDTRLGRTVAVKLLRADLTSDGVLLYEMAADLEELLSSLESSKYAGGKFRPRRGGS